MPRIEDLPVASSVAGTDLLIVSQSSVARQATVSQIAAVAGGLNWFNVVDYGADPTGVADSQSAIQDAIDDAELDGGIVWFPRGYYDVDAGDLIVNGDRVTLMGEGSASQINFGSGDQLRITANNITVCDLRLVGPGDTTQSTADADCGIFITGTSGTSMIGNVTIRNVQVNEFPADGIQANFVSILQITDNQVSQCGYAGIACYSCEDIVIKGNVVASINTVDLEANAYGITLSAKTGSSSAAPICRRAVIADNVVTTVEEWTGIDMHGGEDVAITGNTVTGCPFGIKIASHTQTYNQSARRVTCSGNVVNGTYEQDGIIVRGAYVTSAFVDWCEAISITGNSVFEGGTNTSSQGGITLEGTRGCAVVGNTIWKPRRHGVVLYQENFGFVVSGNIVTDPHSTTAAAAAGAIAIAGDYQTGFIGGNSLIRWNVSGVGEEASAMIVRSSGTTANSNIVFDQNYSEHTGSDYYSGTRESYEWSEQRRSDHIRHTEALTLSGFSTSPTMTVYISKVGDIVTIRFPVGLTGTATSNATTFTTSAIPAEFRPARSQYGFVRLQDAGTTQTTPGIVEVATNGVLSFGLNCSALGGFTNSGTKTTQGGSISYSVY